MRTSVEDEAYGIVRMASEPGFQQNPQFAQVCFLDDIELITIVCRIAYDGRRGPNRSNTARLDPRQDTFDIQ